MNPANDAADLDETFFLRWVNMASRLGVDPVNLARVACSESGMLASAKNPSADANGLIQFMGATLRGLGWTAGSDAFRELSAADQVPFVERYFRPHAQYLLDDSMCYLACFLPALLKYAAESGEDRDSFVIAAEHAESLEHLPAWLRATLVRAYAANKGFDPKHTGMITVGALRARLNAACRGPRYEAIVHRLRLAQGAELPPVPVPDTEPGLPVFEEDGGLSRRSATSEAIAKLSESERCDES